MGDLLKLYDYLIYGGNPAGILFAIIKSKLGKKVLLINNYGFLGGSICSGFNCLQTIGVSKDCGIYDEFFTMIKNDRYGILYSEGTNIIVNPETVKMQLLHILKSAGVNLLFHVNPLCYHVQNSNTVELELVAREGIIKISGRNLVDASENHLIKQIGEKDQPIEVYRQSNFFITKPVNLDLTAFHNIQHAIKLNDGRYFISLISNNIQTESNDYSLEDNARTFNITLTSSGSGARIQLLPVENYIFNEFKHLSRNEPHVFSIEDLLGRIFLPNEQLLKAEEIVIYLNEQE